VLDDLAPLPADGAAPPDVPPIARVLDDPVEAVAPSDPDPEAYRAQVAAGFAALRARDPQVAEAAFRAALEHGRADVNLIYGLAAAWWRQFRFDLARREAERVLARDPDHGPAHALLARLHWRRGDLAGAARHARHAVELVPDRESYSRLREQIERELDVEASFDQRVGRRVILYTPADHPAAAQLAREGVARVDREVERLAEAIGFLPPEPLPVVVYHEREFREVTEEDPFLRGRYDGKVRFYVAGADPWAPLFLQVLRHELVHAILRAYIVHPLPGWLNEGLATFLAAQYRPAYRRRIERAARADGLWTLAELDRGGFDDDEVERRALAYAQSFALADLLLRRLRREGVQQLLVEIASGRPAGEAVVAALGFADLDELEARYRAFLEGVYRVGGNDPRPRIRSALRTLGLADPTEAE